MYDDNFINLMLFSWYLDEDVGIGCNNGGGVLLATAAEAALPIPLTETNILIFTL
jgi:hypothetical protein